MKQIKFDPELIGKPGIVCKVDGEVPDFIKWYPKLRYPVVVITNVGYKEYVSASEDLTMFRQTRSAEEIAREICESFDTPFEIPFEVWESKTQKMFAALVQAGIDEVTDKTK